MTDCQNRQLIFDSEGREEVNEADLKEVLWVCALNGNYC